MKIFIFALSCEAYLLAFLAKNLDRIQTNDLNLKRPFDNKVHNRCSLPCQRIPHYVNFKKALIQYGLRSEIVQIITSKSANDSNGMIDIGQCVGSCRRINSILPCSEVLFHRKQDPISNNVF